MKKKRKSFLRWLMWGVMGILLGAGLYVGIGVMRAGSVEAWAAEQLQDIANHYLVPKLHLGKISYRGGKTIDIESMWLDADDPDQAGKKVRILEVESARMELEEVPSWGKPLKITALYLQRPVVRFVKGKDGGKLVGFGRFVAGQAASESAPATESAKSASGQTRPSDVFQIRLMKIDNGTIEYDARAQGEDPLRLDGIHSELHVAREAEAGWYGVQLTADRKPVFDMTVKGRLSVNTLDAEVKELVMGLELSAETKHYLPQNVQKLVDEYEMAGKLKLTLSGKLPLANPGAGDLTVGLKLTQGNLSIRGYAVPVEEMVGELGIHHNMAELTKMTAKAMGGTLDFSGDWSFDGKSPLRMKVHGENIHLARTLKTLSKDGKKPVMAGLVSGELSYEAPPKAWNKEAKGEGILSLRNGHLPDLPVLGEIEQQIVTLGKVVVPIKETHDDEADLKFAFDGAVVHVRDLSARSSMMEFRGGGDVGFDGALNIEMNAGPLEMVESKLGKFGAFVGKLTDAVGRYRVGGTLKKPQVALEFGPK